MSWVSSWGVLFVRGVELLSVQKAVSQRLMRFNMCLCSQWAAAAQSGMPCQCRQLRTQRTHPGRKQQQSRVFPSRLAITIITPGPGRTGARRHVKQKCHGGQPWESRSGPSLSFHMECDTRGRRSWIRHGLSGPRGLALSICHLHAWPKPRKRWKGEEKSIQSAYSVEFRSRFRRESQILNGGFDQIALSINWLYGRRLVWRFKVHCEDCWYLRNESLCMRFFLISVARSF